MAYFVRHWKGFGSLRISISERKYNPSATYDDGSCPTVHLGCTDAEAANYRDIVMRQKTIKGFFIAPKATYVAKEAEVRALEAQLAQLGV